MDSQKTHVQKSGSADISISRVPVSTYPPTPSVRTPLPQKDIDDSMLIAGIPVLDSDSVATSTASAGTKIYMVPGMRKAKASVADDQELDEIQKMKDVDRAFEDTSEDHNVKDTQQVGDYTADNIQILEGLEGVRRRPGMYIGSTSARGLHHLVYEIVDNAVDEALAGFCSVITVTVNPDNSVTVVDNGRGIPVDIQKKAGISALEVVFTILHHLRLRWCTSN